MRGVEAELEPGEGGILVWCETGAPEVDGGDGPVAARLEHERQPQVRVCRAGEPRRHVQCHLQRLCSPAIKTLSIGIPSPPIL